ncbi:MAG: ATP-binding cassette domain-containing protein [bacterium]|nr:ATP-binding cassette domain-containing protein [bacterium]
MINVSELSMNFGKQVLFEDASFQLNPGGRYGLVGANGSGKSTLLKIMSGQVKAEAGEVNMPSDMKLGLLRQDHFEYEEHRILDVVMMGRPALWNALKEKEALAAAGGDVSSEVGHRLGELEMVIADQDGYQAEPDASELLAGLGVGDVERPLKALSGGYKLRVLLAQCLFGRPDFLFLDEPTNHLDLASIAWLESYLEAFEGAFVIISHDRHFLNQVCNQMIDIDYEEIRVYKGNYDGFIRQKALEREQKESEIQRQEKKKEDLQAFVDRFKAKASKARQASSKSKQIEKMDDIVIKRSSRIKPKFRFEQTRPSGKEALNIKGLSKSFGEKKVINGLDLKVLRGQRLAIIGPNGIGKSTLLKIILGQLTADAGEVEPGHEVQIGYFPQDHHEQVPPNSTPYEWLYSFESGAPIGKIRGLLARVLLGDDDVHKSTGNISGGEAARLILARIMLEQPNLLLIDEPTNHMDIESIEALSEALCAFDGTLICVSHDRRFIESVATSILELTPAGFTYFEGSYHEYLAKEGADYLDRSAQPSSRPAVTTPKVEKPAGKSSQDSYNAKKDANRLKKAVRNKEKKVGQLESKVKAIDAELAEGTLFKPVFKKELAEKLAEKADLESQVTAAEAEWSEAQDKLDQLLAEFPEVAPD